MNEEKKFFDWNQIFSSSSSSTNVSAVKSDVDGVEVWLEMIFSSFWFWYFIPDEFSTWIVVNVVVVVESVKLANIFVIGGAFDATFVFDDL